VTSSLIVPTGSSRGRSNADRKNTRYWTDPDKKWERPF